MNVDGKIKEGMSKRDGQLLAAFHPDLQHILSIRVAAHSPHGLPAAVALEASDEQAHINVPHTATLHYILKFYSQCFTQE